MNNIAKGYMHTPICLAMAGVATQIGVYKKYQRDADFNVVEALQVFDIGDQIFVTQFCNGCAY